MATAVKGSGGQLVLEVTGACAKLAKTTSGRNILRLRCSLKIR
eukprot:CAMPEP_0114686168 /NCGR_PEP_ID=MMETSP0191-20121206/61223_1 /TAXON_ID=126664 /ORGANISM="Sorites sp." /LENGTH=42 /DNA_ID= /DNA_START= /DNA_END= /DNA_ORIENTATION=